ncbi:MAG: 2-phosphosulfolactate phosphatase, partial [Chthoniobacterales bacterium]|nr:2-phosphosulfolactate phosphatase [Chthoniobacterales bacterium]
MKVETLLGPADIQRLTPGCCEGWTCVVFDILRATTCIVTALHSGAARVIPVVSIEEAIAYKREKNHRALLAGERNGDPIPGFDLGNSP